MSFSLALVPVALALRVVMGRDNFQRWVQEMHVKVPTTFADEFDLLRSVRQAGYDAEVWGGVRKTRVDDHGHVMMWELVDGAWVAVFSRADGEEFMRRTMHDLESKTGRRIFTVQADGAGPTEPARQSFPTNFRDGTLLMQTLREYGVNPARQPDGEIVCTLGSSTVRFRPAADGPYSVEVDNTPDLPAIFQQLSTLDDDYKRCVQAMVYEKLKEKIEGSTLMLEGEEVLDDNSIVLTLTVPE